MARSVKQWHRVTSPSFLVAFPGSKRLSTGFRCACSATLALACSAIHGQSSPIHSSVPEGPDNTYLSPVPSDAALRPRELEQQYAFGDWGGLRSTLGRRGIVPTLILISDPFGNVHGGQRTGAAVYSLAGFDLRFDSAALFGWEGGQFAIGGAVNFGTSLSRSYVGNSFPIQLADCAGAQPRLTYLTYTQRFWSNRLDARVGRLTLNSVFGEEFAGSEYFKKFVTIGFDLIPQGLFFDVSGAAGYPRTTWGLRVRHTPTKGFYTQTAVYNADMHQLEGNQHGLDFSIKGPVFAIGEIGWKHFGKDDETTPNGNIKGGGFYTGGTHYTVRNHELTPVTGVYGFYALADQRLWTIKAPSGTPRASMQLSRWGEAELERHVGAFASLVVMPENRTNMVPYFFNLGLMSYGLSARRPKDLFGAGFVYASNSRVPGPTPVLPNSVTNTIPVPPNEQTIEVTYGLALKPGVLFQPDFQYIVHPKGIGSLPIPAGSAGVQNAVVAGANIVINF